MSLSGKEFLVLRKKAMIQRRDNFNSKSHSDVPTLPEIAAKLKETLMVRGKNKAFITIDIVGRGRTAALLSGYASKKRKLNGGEALDRENYLKTEMESLKAEITSLRMGLMDAQT